MSPARDREKGLDVSWLAGAPAKKWGYGAPACGSVWTFLNCVFSETTWTLILLLSLPILATDRYAHHPPPQSSTRRDASLA